MNTTLPSAFQPFADEIAASTKPTVPFTLSTEATQLWDSKVGGTPYLPKGADYPHDAAGNPFFFLAQINFAQMPPLPDFPSKGILQFYFANDDVYGINFDDFHDHSGYKLIYHADVIENADELQQTNHNLQTGDCAPFNPEDCYRIHFQAAQQQAITQFDCQFDDTVPQVAQFLNQQLENSSNRNTEWQHHTDYDEYTQAESHRVGGYPYFTQADVRGWNDDEFADYILLFQMVSDWNESNGVDIMWGDCGVANFFIRPEDLNNLHFDDAFFTMDCC